MTTAPKVPKTAVPLIGNPEPGREIQWLIDAVRSFEMASFEEAANDVDFSAQWNALLASSGIGVSDGDKGDVIVTVDGTVWTFDPSVVTSFARLLLASASASAARSELGLGTAATQSTSAFAAASHTHPAAEVSDFSEAVDDRVAALLVAGTNITITYNDGANTITIDASGGGGVSDGDKGHITVSASGATWTIDATFVGTALTAENAAIDDVDPIYDTSAAAYKGITVLERAQLIDRVSPDFTRFKTPILYTDVGGTFTALNSPTTAADTFGKCQLSMTGASGRWDTKAIVRSLGAGPWTIYAEIDMLQFYNQSYAFAGLIIRESATSKFEQYGIAGNRGYAMNVWCSYGTNLAANNTDESYPGNSFMTFARYFKWTLSGTTLTQYASIDGIYWATVGSHALTTRFTTAPDEAGIFVANYNDTTNIVAAVCHDFLIT